MKFRKSRKFRKYWKSSNSDKSAKLGNSEKSRKLKNNHEIEETIWKNYENHENQGINIMIRVVVWRRQDQQTRKPGTPRKTIEKS